MDNDKEYDQISALKIMTHISLLINIMNLWNKFAEIAKICKIDKLGNSDKILTLKKLDKSVTKSINIHSQSSNLTKSSKMINSTKSSDLQIRQIHQNCLI